MNFYKEVELILEAKSPHVKIELFGTFYNVYKSGQVDFEKEYKTKNFDQPSIALRMLEETELSQSKKSRRVLLNDLCTDTLFSQ